MNVITLLIVGGVAVVTSASANYYEKKDRADIAKPLKIYSASSVGAASANTIYSFLKLLEEMFL